jgi:hypothetical protein
MTVRATVALALCVCLAAGPAWADTARVTAASANLRSAPNIGSRVVSTLARGTRLEVLESAGEWLKVRVLDTRAEGYVNRRLVEVAPGPPAAPAAPSAKTPPPAAPPAATAGGAAVSIDHRDVGCIVAGQYPRLEACFRPEASVGRGRVLFRAAGTDPWYYVDMTHDGACHSAVLPKPKPELKAMEYFVDVIDKAFAEVQMPERAPDQSFTPRVVKKQEDCDPARKMALFLPRLTRPVVVGIARDPSGGILTAAAAKVLESKALLAGFSSDGVVVSSTGAAPGASASTSTSGSTSASGAAGGGGLPTVAIVGGIAAAGALVAVAAAGGGGGGSGSGGSGGSSGGSAPGGGTSGGGQATTVAGQWVGNSGSGNGLLYQFGEEGISCTFRYDITASLTQSGGNVGGSMNYAGRTHTCSVPDSFAQQLINAALAGMPGDSGGFPVSGTANESGAVTLNMGGITFMGTFRGNTMDLAANAAAAPGLSQFSMTMKLVRQ